MSRISPDSSGLAHVATAEHEVDPAPLAVEIAPRAGPAAAAKVETRDATRTAGTRPCCHEPVGPQLRGELVLVLVDELPVLVGPDDQVVRVTPPDGLLAQDRLLIGPEEADRLEVLAVQLELNADALVLDRHRGGRLVGRGGLLALQQSQEFLARQSQERSDSFLGELLHNGGQ